MWQMGRKRGLGTMTRKKRPVVIYAGMRRGMGSFLLVRSQITGFCPATTHQPPPPPRMRYATRNHALVPAMIWTLDGAALLLDDGKGPPRMVPLDRVRALRLDFAPTRPERNRFRCRLTLMGGEILTFFNRTYAGFSDFRDTSAEYVAFVQGLVAALRQHAPGCRFRAGAGGPVYVLNVLATVFVFCCFGAIAWFLFLINLTWLLAVKILILIFYVPVLIYWVVRNRPRTFPPAAIPTDLLPAVGPVTAAKP